MNAFRIDLALPPGATLVEASAGTGKTWSIARLVARLVAEDPPEGGEPPTIDKILVVTFTEAATAELRDRIRAVLTETADALDIVRRDGDAARCPADPAHAAVARDAAGSAPDTWRPAPTRALTTRAERLRRAVVDFDRAPVSTIHGFCQRVLATLSFEADAPFDVEVLADVDALVEEIVDDWYASHVVPMDPATFAWFRDVAQLDRARLLSLARARVGHRGAVFLPAEGEDWQVRAQAFAPTARALGGRCAGPEGDALLAHVKDWTATGRLKRTSYKLPTLDTRWQDLCAWLAGGALGPRPSGVDLFHATRVNDTRTDLARRAGEVFECDLASALEAFSDQDGVADGLIGAFAAHVDRTWRARLEHRNAITFDDLLERVATGLHRRDLVEALRARHRVALIDEFQDTDAVQWTIFRTVFLEDSTARLVLIGDPKQAIYGFRGADVSVYTAACRAVPQHRRFTMTRNFRSDRPLVDALNAVYAARPGCFLTPDIAYDAVEASHPPRLHHGATPVAPFVVRWFDRARLGLSDAPSNAEESPAGSSRPVANGVAAEALARVVARDIRRDLEQDWRIRDRDTPRPVHAGDIAVLAATNPEADRLREALLAEGVPAVVANTGSVFESDECTWLQRWLGALTAEGDDGAARTVAVTPLFGFTAMDLIESRRGTDPEATSRWMRFKDRLAYQERLWMADGITAACSDLLYAESPPDGRSALQRLAARNAGERHLTNLRHLVELLDGAAQAKRLGAAGLMRWLADRRARTDAADGAEFRLDADTQNVKVITMHRSKGLEYPIVYVPGLADGRVLRGANPRVQPVRFHDPDGVLTVDLRGLEAGNGLAARRALMEERQRLLYVALTRAAHRVVLYAGPTSGNAPGRGLPPQDYAQSPLAVLFHGSTPAEGQHVRETGSEALLDEVRRLAPGHVVVEDVEPVAASDGRALPGAVPPEVPPRVFTRGGLDTHWRRESYTGIVGRHGNTKGTPTAPPEDEDDDADDDADAEAVPAVDEEDSGSPQLPGETVPEVPLGAFHRGAEAGKWVHDVLERVSFPSCTPRRGGTLAALVRGRGARRGFLDAHRDPLLVDALPRWLETPLGAALGGLCLRDVPDHDRVDELKFDMAIGTSTRGRTSGTDLLQALGAARADDPMPRGYLAQVRGMDTRPLAGFMTGAIDLVFRASIDARVQWFVVDYKTNTLGRGVAGGRARPTAEDYGQDGMRAEMARKHYYLQSMIYLTALHRYLSVRLGDRYDYDRDVGGALYLFVRGMLGTGTRSVDGRTHGVFHDKPPRATIERISRVLGGAEECR